MKGKYIMRDFKNIKEIYETSNQSEANNFLEKGWHLLDIYQKVIAGFQSNQISPVYILGRPKNVEEKARDIKKELEEKIKKAFEAYKEEENI